MYSVHVNMMTLFISEPQRAVRHLANTQDKVQNVVPESEECQRPLCFLSVCVFSFTALLSTAPTGRQTRQTATFTLTGASLPQAVFMTKTLKYSRRQLIRKGNIMTAKPSEWQRFTPSATLTDTLPRACSTHTVTRSQAMILLTESPQ